MIYFTKYAEQKFDILNEHKVYFTREQIEEAVTSPGSNKAKGRYFCAIKQGVGVIYSRQETTIKIITFYPVK